MYRQKKSHVPNRTRPASSVNLGRLADVVGADTLASSLGISESQLHKVIRGGPDALDYRVHIAHRLDETGMSSAWLDQPDARIKPEFVKALRKLAGKSADPAPLRRQNLLKLARNVAGGQLALSDVLEMTEHSFEKVLQGQFPIDDERFSHINPRLMAGGFPDGWLDQPQASLNPTWITRLFAIAQGGESADAPADDILLPTDASMPEAGDPPPLSILTATESASPMESFPPTQDLNSVREPNVDVSLPEPDSSSGGQGQDSTADAAANPASRKRRRRRPAQRVGTVENAGQPEAETDGKAESSPTPSTRNAKSTSVEQPRSKRGRRTVVPTSSSETASEDVPRDLSEGDDGNATAVPRSLDKVDAEQPDEDASRRSNPPISRETSLKRAEALDKLLSTARRGTKVTLWRDLLKLSLPYWGNIRRGNILMRDGVAQAVTHHLGLPDDWLDQPTFPPATIADWVMDGDVPLPRVSAFQPEEDRPAVTAPAPDSRPPQKSAVRRKRVEAEVVDSDGRHNTVSPPAAAMPFHLAVAPAVKASTKAAPTASADANSRPEAVPPEQRSDAPVKSEAPVVAAPKSIAQERDAFRWTPASDPQPRSTPGPLVEALSLVLSHLSLNGEFTDDDALRMMALLSTKR